MLQLLTNRALRLTAIAAVLSTGTMACADTRNDRVADAGSRYVYLGQSAVILPAPEVRQADTPYALTGDSQVRRDRWNGQGHWIEAGQSKVFIPADAH